MTDQPGRQCPWCAAPASPDDTLCHACGAALAQRNSIGDVPIPGLTSVDPALEELDKRPIQLRGPSPSHGIAPALVIGAIAGGPIGLVAIGGVAAVAGAEFLARRHGGPGSPNPEDVGKPNELMLQALEHQRETEAKAASDSGLTTGSSPAGEPGAAPGSPTCPAEEPGAADADHGMSIWRDLPPAER